MSKTMEIDQGDVLEFVQENGNLLIIYVRPDAIIIKANNVGTHLQIDKDSLHLAKAMAVDNR